MAVSTFMPNAFSFDGVGELLGDLIVDIGIQQRAAHVLQRGSDIQFCDLPFTLEYLERPFKSIS